MHKNTIKKYIICKSNYLLFSSYLIIVVVHICLSKINEYNAYKYKTFAINNFIISKKNQKKIIKQRNNNLLYVTWYNKIKITNSIQNAESNFHKYVKLLKYYRHVPINKHDNLLFVNNYIKNTNHQNIIIKNNISYKLYDTISLNSLICFLTTKKRLRVSSNFSMHRLNPITGHIRPHRGIDIALPTDTPIFAINKGEVIIVKTGNISSAGNYVAIFHKNGYITRYMHMNKIFVRKGQKIKYGDTIGLSGNTGYSTGPHLHFELWINNKAIDPLKVHLPIKSIIIK
ncbi:hypothetical protein CRV11_00665 [Candidatus Pantoea edessiphila]|uniref:M23ase beta-sheet core domain-containing protein n=1 Tax=Candidatus Pantoea edessiphila TaxID=2044610 RepID=A0A2P5SYM7_9GAMM|nr:peptidoglycan DD-metalloendopeptidase family protein [Pantoea sp. Edef]PPI87434.1 hypothetical protein CRV11_00665 [Candidatus Pantoea edessiphila]